MENEEENILNVDSTSTTFFSYMVLFFYSACTSAVTLWPLIFISHVSFKNNMFTIMVTQIISVLILFGGHISSKQIYKQRSAFYRQNLSIKESKKSNKERHKGGLIDHVSEQESTYLSILNNIPLFLIIQMILCQVIFKNYSSITSYVISVTISSITVFFISNLNI